MRSPGQDDFFCRKMPVVLAWWDACAESNDSWLIGQAVIWESQAGATFVLVGTPDSPVLLSRRPKNGYSHPQAKLLSPERQN